VGRSTPAGKVIDGDPALCEYFIAEAKVAVVPGSAFYAPGYVRLSYATSQANIEKGLGRIGEALARLR
jgi:aspartate aminotransferase